jgi:hypothetical protein
VGDGAGSALTQEESTSQAAAHIPAVPGGDAILSQIAPLSRDILRRIPQLFPLPAEDFPLDPSFEKTSGAADIANTARFDDLQALNRVHLVTPVGATHMYGAAMGSTACRLTPSGRYYWRLATDDRI